MGSAVFTDAETAVGTDDLHVQTGIAHGVADLLPGTAGSKHGEGVDEGLLAAGGQAGGHAHHVALSDAHVEEPVGIGLHKALGHGSARQVGVEHHQLGILLSQLYQRIAVGGTGCDFLCHDLALQFLQFGFQLGLGLGHLLVVGRLAMPAGVVLHEAHALALDGLGQNHSGLALGGGSFLEGLDDLVIVVAVDLDDVPAEGLALLVQRLGGHDVGGAAVDLQAVHVDDGAQVVQLILGSGHESLPNLALGDFAVAQDGVDAVIPVVELAAQSHTDSGGNALAQRAGGHIDTGNVVHFHVAGHMGVNAAELLQALHGEEAPQGQRGIQSGRAVALGHDKAVTVRVLGILGVHLHDVEVESGQHVQAAEGAAGMAGGSVMYHLDCQQTGFGRVDGQSLILVFHSDPSFSIRSYPTASPY